MKMKRLLMATVALVCAGVGVAQVVPAAKETGNAVAESTQEAGDHVKAATESEPNKTVDKVKAKAHKTKARVHRHKAKKAAKAVSP